MIGDIASLRLHLKRGVGLSTDAAGTTPAAATDLVARWNDPHDANRYAVQATEANRPTFAAAGFNTLPGLTFSGARHMDLNGVSLDPSQGMTAVFAVRLSETSTARLRSILGQVGGSSIHWRNAAQGTAPSRYATALNGSVVATTGGMHPDQTYQHTWKCQLLSVRVAAAGAVDWRFFGQPVGSGSGSVAANTGAWRLGTNGAADQGWLGDIGEVALFGEALDDATLAAVEHEVGASCGLTPARYLGAPFLNVDGDNDTHKLPHLVTTEDALAGTWRQCGPWPTFRQSPLSIAGDAHPFYWQGRWWQVYTGGQAIPIKSFGLIRATDDDLWQWEKVAQVSTESAETVQGAAINRTWSPKVYVDDDGTLHAFVSLSFTDISGPWTPWYVTSTDPDLLVWSDCLPVAWDPNEPNVIDWFTVHRRGSDYYEAWYKDETTKTTEVATASSLTGPYTRIRNGQWGGGVVSWQEGVSLIRHVDRWQLWLDNYNNVPMGMRASESFSRLAGWSTLTQPPQPSYWPAIRNGVYLDAHRESGSLPGPADSSRSRPVEHALLSTFGLGD
jgi:hypothetical protein